MSVRDRQLAHLARGVADSLYGTAGFYRTQQPAEHFRTSATASAVFADAILALLRREGLDAVTEMGEAAVSSSLPCMPVTRS